MVEPFYKKRLIEAMLNKESVVLRTEQRSFLDDCADFILFLTQRSDVIVIKFDPDGLLTRFISKGGDVDKLTILHGLFNGSLQEAEISVYRRIVELKEAGSKSLSVVFVCSEDFARDESINYFGIFYPNFVRRVADQGIPFFSLVQYSENALLLEIISSSADEIIPIREEKLVK